MYALVNEGNIQSLTKELLDYLQVADADFKPDLTAKIAALVQRFAPNKRWHFDSLLQVRCHPKLSLSQAGSLSCHCRPSPEVGRKCVSQSVLQSWNLQSVRTVCLSKGCLYGCLAGQLVRII